jgi:Domain of unknown function DUF29
MAEVSLYETDVYAWSEQQADALRRLASRRDLPNELDLANLAEEIESLGKSELRAARSFVRLILAHLVKAWADPQPKLVRHWASEVVTGRNELADTITPAIEPRIDMDRAWRMALDEAVAALLDAERSEAAAQVASVLPLQCPLGLSDLLSERFDFKGLACRLSGVSNGLEQVDLPDPLRPV